MASQEPGNARLIVADPPYNMRKASWDRLGTSGQYLDWTLAWVTQARRLLTPDGTLYLCGLPETLARISVTVGPLFASLRFLVWSYRNKGNMANDWGRSHEGILHLRAGRSMVFNTDAVRVAYNHHTLRYPEHPQASTSKYGGSRPRVTGWTPHPRGARPRDVLEVPILCNGSAEKLPHPTQKPVELLRRLVLASSHEGDLVIDPFGGTGTTFFVCEGAGRRWKGCEQDLAYCRVAQQRLEQPHHYKPRADRESAQQRARRRARLRFPA